MVEYLSLTTAEVVKRRVSTEAISWYRRMLAAPDSRAPLLLRCMLRISPARRLILSTRSALQARLGLKDAGTLLANHTAA